MKICLPTVVLLLASLVLPQCGLQEPQPVNDADFNTGENSNGPHLTVIGDSQSTGVIASTTMGEQPPSSLISNLLPFFYSNNPSIATLQEHFSEYRNSAMTTDESWGLRGTLGKESNLEAKDVTLYLAAQWGGKVRHLPDLIEKLRRSYEQTGSTPDFILLMLGANDLCNGEPSLSFEGNFAHGLQLIAESLPHATLMVAAIPPIPQLLRYDHNYNETLTCEQVRQRFCPAIFAQDFKQHYVEYNASIERVVKSFQGEYRSPIIFVDGFRGMYFKQNMLAFDCFHPNSNAQKRYAEFFTQAYRHFLANGN